jgi:hypothetical protein
MSNYNNTLSAPKQAVAFPLGVIKQALAVCFTPTLNLVPVIWGPVGWTKSATVKSVADNLDLPLFDVRLSDKEPTDLGGIPYPTDKEFNGEVQKVLHYLANSLLPWADLYGDDYECVLFFDEVDRTSVDVLNVALQLLLDRGVNGRKLSKNCHIICAGNGSTDTGTTELTSAAATRLVHFYVETSGPRALDHWVDWANGNGIDPALVGYARFRPEVFGGPKHTYTEQQQSNPRTFTWAAAALNLLDQLPFEPEVGDSIVFGLVGQAAGREYIAYREQLAKCPTFDKVVADPDKAALPPETQVGIPYALGEAFVNRLLDPTAEQRGLSPEINPDNTKAVAKYFSRLAATHPCHREAVAWFFRQAGRKVPSLAGLPEYKAFAA